MNRQFNLLPARHVERMAERRSAGVAAAGLALLVALLAVTSLFQSRQLSQAQSERDAEQDRNAQLQERRRELAPFRQLADGITGRERLLAASMQAQVSWSAVLSSLSSTFPPDASLTSFTAESTLPAFGAVVEAGDEGRVIGSGTLSGYSVQAFEPGVERILRLLEEVTGLAQPRLQEGAVEEISGSPVTTFDGTTFVDGAALSGRYAEGLPPEDDVGLPPVGGAAPAPAAPGSPPAGQ